MNSKDKSSGNSNSTMFNGKYEQVRLLGEGSFGKAFLVESIEDKSLAVIKAIDLGNMTDEEKQDAILEGKILEKLDHSNIIKFREVYIENKNSKHILYIVMDYADGGDLQLRIRGQKGKYFNETMILDWFTQICLSIKHIHDRKIIHRDIKSQNIFLTKNGLVKLGDFGIAKCLNKTMDKAKTIVGTPYYLSPEIIQNRPYNFKSDIWSLGVLLYEMCALKMPFDAQNLPLLSLKIIRCSYNPLPPNFSKELRTLINNMLSVDANKRFSINEVLRQPIIKSRIKNFLNEIEFNKEFSHTMLHNFKIYRGSKQDLIDLQNGGKEVKDSYRESKDREQGSANGKNDEKISNRDVNYVINSNLKDVNYQKPIIKKDSGNVNANNNLVNKRKNFHYKNEEKEVNVNVANINKEKEIENNVINLKRNLSSGISSQQSKENNKKELVVNSFAVNYEKDNNKNKIKSSIEIDSNRMPKVEPAKIMPDSKSSNERRNSEKKSEICSNIVYENLKKKNLNIKKDLNMNNNLNNCNREIVTSKKNSESNLQTNNSSTADNQSDRKRSESRGSQQDDGKEKPIQLKDFMKNMKETLKNNPPPSEVIWMKGMKDFMTKEKESNNVIKKEKDIEIKPHSNNMNYNINITSSNVNSAKNSNSENINYHYKNKNSRDMKEYIETQKMLIELEKLQNEELLEIENDDGNENEYNNNDYADILQEFKDLDEDLLANEDYFQDCEKENIIKNYFSNPGSTDLDTNSVSNEVQIENSLQTFLECELGKELFNKTYKILNENLNSEILFFDLEGINSKIKQECSSFDENAVEMSLSKVPDIYCLVLKDRERKNK